AFLELDHHAGVRDVVREPGVVHLVHDRPAEYGAAARDRHPVGIAAEAAAADVARREAVRAAGATALDDELVATRRLPEWTHRGRDLGQRLRVAGILDAHDASRARPSVLWVESTPPLPDTSATSCRGT